MTSSPSLSIGPPARRLMSAFRISVALAIITATSWLMTHQVQAPSRLQPSAASIGTSDGKLEKTTGIIRGYPVGAALQSDD
jgi:hypothetical protein